MFDPSNTPDELLHAFIDDELAPESEEQFYANLAADADLRARLRQMRTIRGEARRFRTAAAPPHDLSDAVFNRLGFTAKPSKQPGRILGAAILMHRVWTPVASASAAAILTATLIFALQDNAVGSRDATLALRDVGAPATQQAVPADQGHGMNHVDAPPNTQISNPSTTAATSHRAASDAIATHAVAGPSVTRFRTDATTPDASGSDAAPARPEQPTHAGYDAASVLPAVPSLADASPSADDDTQSGKINPSGTPAVADLREADGYPSATYVETPDFWAATRSDGERRRDGGIDAVQADRGLPMAGDQSVDTRQYFPLLNASPLLSFVTVELRGINAASFPATDMSTRSDPWMQNMAVAVFYSDDRSDYGLEFGQEAFSQRYSGMEYGKGVVYEQNLLTSWLLAGYRHRFQPVFGAVEPYVSLGAGTTMQAWPLARFGAGFMYMPDRRVRFHLGLEGAVLAYPFQERWFSSERAGLSYGISLLF